MTIDAPRAEADKAAFIRSVAWKTGLDHGAQVAWWGDTAVLRYPEPLIHPWPRQVAFQVEVLAPSLPALAEARAQDDERPQRISVFDCRLQDDAEQIARAGYTGCWDTHLLGAVLDAVPRAAAAGVTFEPVERAEQIEELNALETPWPSHPQTLREPQVLELLARRDGRAIGKGQIVSICGEVAYVADMFTCESERRTGVASALLSALHEAAATRGARRTVLTASLMAAQSGFYLHRGYERVCSCAVLLAD